jgi:hypothetical protein
VAIYTKLGKEVLRDTIRIDGECYAGEKVIKIRASIAGESEPRSLYITDLLADDGKDEIQNAIKAALSRR